MMLNSKITSKLIGTDLFIQVEFTPDNAKEKSEVFSDELFSLKESLIVESLVKLGWTPPDHDQRTATFASKYPDEVNDVIDNMLSVIDEAGGAPNVDTLLNKPLIDVLVNVFATNGIRFHFKKRKRPSGKALRIKK